MRRPAVTRVGNYWQKRENTTMVNLHAYKGTLPQIYPNTWIRQWTCLAVDKKVYDPTTFEIPVMIFSRNDFNPGDFWLCIWPWFGTRVDRTQDGKGVCETLCPENYLWCKLCASIQSRCYWLRLQQFIATRIWHHCSSPEAGLAAPVPTGPSRVEGP